MRPFLSAALMTLGLAAPVWAADPLEGFWVTARDDNGNFGLVEVAACGEYLCGTLVRAYGPNGLEIPSDNIGRKLIWDTVHKGNGIYRGKVYSPDRNKTYNSKLVLEDAVSLSVSGCRFGICREGGRWRKQ